MTPPSSIILMIAPPGVSLGPIVQKLKTRLNAEVADIEDEIKQNPETTRILQAISANFAPPFDMQTVAHHIPRDQVAGLWKEALRRCIDLLEDSKKSVRILSGHVTYYSVKRSEFYSVVNFRPLLSSTKLRVNKILLLIDDVYDMYARLRKLYSSYSLAPFMRRMNVDPNKSPKEKIARATMAWKMRNILHLLSWRNIEPILAENLARQMNADFLVWPVKQSNIAIEKWLKSQTKPVYLSHPITDPRIHRNEAGRWPDFVLQANRLQEKFADYSITLVEPTGIDELRFSMDKAGSQEGPHYTGHLDARWPLTTVKSNMLYVEPQGQKGVEYSDFMRPQYWNQDRGVMIPLKSYGKLLRDEIHAYSQVLVGEIESQISSRDLSLVYHTQGLLVFRPLFGRLPRPGFSSGVDSEVRLWEDMVQLGVPSRIAFIHFDGDVQTMLQVRDKKDLRQLIVDQMWILLKGVSSIGREIVETMVLNHGSLQQQEDILNKSNVSPSDAERFERAYRQYWRPAKVEVLRRFLNDAVVVDTGDDIVGIWIVKNYDVLQHHLSDIANFLKNQTTSGKLPLRGNNWEERVDSLFRDDLIG